MALLAALGGAPCGAQLLRTVDAGDGLYLHQVGARAWVRQPSGDERELTLPPGVALQRLAPLADGWIAAGEVDASGMTELILLRSEAGVVSPLAAPADPRRMPLRGGPVPLVAGGRLAGLAWLAGEGVRQTAVWAARWSGLGWSTPELVSPAGPGTQIAIDGAVLADGSWLLVWSAYDGDDDEILWSRRVDGGWSEPARLHEPNGYPDITPSLVATRRGALVAWNGYDGSLYRARLARFENGAWRDQGTADEAGAVGPELVPGARGALLVYRTVVPSAWAVHELGPGGRLLRSAALATETTARPALARPAAAAPRFEWPAGRPPDVESTLLEWRDRP